MIFQLFQEGGAVDGFTFFCASTLLVLPHQIKVWVIIKFTLGQALGLLEQKRSAMPGVSGTLISQHRCKLLVTFRERVVNLNEIKLLCVYVCPGNYSRIILCRSLI